MNDIIQHHDEASNNGSDPLDSLISYHAGVAGNGDFDGDTLGILLVKPIPDYENIKVEDD